MPDVTADDLNELALAPQTTNTGGLVVTERPAADVIALAREAAEQAAQAAAAAGKPKSGWARLTPAVAVPPGSA